MKDFINRPAFIRSLEFWTATSIFVVVLFFRISAMLGGETWHLPVLEANGATSIPEHYYRLYFFPSILQYTALYASFLILNFVIVPRIVAKRAIALHIAAGLAIMALLGLALATLDTYLRNAILRDYPSIRQAHFVIFRERGLFMIWATIVYVAYAAAIQGCIYLVSNLQRVQQRYPFVSFGAVLAMSTWLISLFFLLIVWKEQELLAFWAIFPPSSILLYVLFSGYLIPTALKKRKPFRFYLGRSFLVLLAAFLPVGLVATVISNRPDIGFPAAMLNSIVQFLVATPVTWVFYMRRQKATEELRGLREKLGQSKANLDFLRSQINPHFLFNALNTIYGTALEEKAERTGEGVHRLGEMMRFMLQENTQEEIPLSREIEYLNNYIALQRLRTDVHPGIEIKTEIPEDVSFARIAPMLLIPFVENAFKHGISFRQPSYIRIAMELRGDTLNFDVHNSRHPKSESDPEQHSGGIGLQNVRQRLELLYPERHELIIRETGREFFVHLTIRLHEQASSLAPAVSKLAFA